ncbi:hypothetical protein [Chondromyces apiculatus]|uniref:Lipoprotein n=1 Tax=Chondromyces apiculatus DSM 436 TaxID=1192034 RepID=A0A017STK5_9BACT|nr:hypothetical protein [Chondromyces apiculatus]EYF00077.1 Hypothetical protein CAP_1399 [Chondromyces apiculatus DSM 436]
MHRGTAQKILLAAGVVATLLVACGGNVVVDHELSSGSGGAGGYTTVVGVGAGQPTTTSSVTSTGVGGNTGVPDTIRSACPELAAEMPVCIMVDYEGIVAVSPRTGEQCRLLSDLQGAITSSDASSIAVIGEQIHWCNFESLNRISLEGVVRSVPYLCQAVTTWEGKLLVRSYGQGTETLKVHGSLEDIEMGVPPEDIFYTDDDNSRWVASETTLYSAWHSTSEIRRVSFPSLEPQPSLALQGFDGWVMGMWPDEAEGVMLVNSYGRFLTFDLTSGAKVGEVVTSSGDGIHCWK